jgi:hypothetical protein
MISSHACLPPLAITSKPTTLITIQLLAVVMVFFCSRLSAQTYETTYQTETSDNTSACSSAGDNSTYPSSKHASVCLNQFNMVGSDTPPHNPVPGNVSHVNVHTLLWNQSVPVYAAMMGWWGKGGTQGYHSKKNNVQMNSGYDSDDTGEIKLQLDDLQARGYDGATLAWYGTDDFSDTAFAAILNEADNRTGFKVAPRINEAICGTKDSGGHDSVSTACLEPYIDQIAAQYFSHPGYLKLDKRNDGYGPLPVISLFMTRDEIHEADWQAMVQHAGHGPILFMTKDSAGVNEPDAAGHLIDGGYAWSVAGTQRAPGDYSTDNATLDANANASGFTDQFAWEDANKGMNMEFANWGSTVQPQSCGKRYIDWVNKISAVYSASGFRTLDGLLVDTWNDYEEGTEVETGIDNCMNPTSPITMTVTGNQLHWDVHFATYGSSSGSPVTIDHYDLYYANPNNESQLHKFGSESCGSASCDATLNGGDPNLETIPSGTYKIYIKAVGKPNILNHMNAPADAGTYSNGSAPNLTISPISSFGNQQIGTSSPSQLATVTNNGSASAIVNSVQPTNGFEVLSSNCEGANLAPGNTCTFSIAFLPSAVLTYSGQVTVTSTAPDSPTTAPLAGTGVNSDSAVATGQIDEGTWTACGAPNCSPAAMVSSPSRDGNAVQFHFGGSGSFASGTWTQNLAADYSNTTQFTYDFWVNVPVVTTPHTVEFQAIQVSGGRKYPFIVQCQFESTRTWRVWQEVPNSWVDTGKPCSFTAGQWSHVVAHFQRNSDQSMHYQDAVVDGTYLEFDKYVSSISTTASNSLQAAVNLTGKSTSVPFDAYVDQMMLAGTPGTTLRDADTGSWTPCAAPTCSAVTNASTPVVAPSPNTSSKFSYAGNAAFQGGKWTANTTVPSSSSTYALDFWLNVPNTTTPYQINFGLTQIVGGEKYSFQAQCQLQSTQHWRFWSDSGGNNWLDSGQTCSLVAGQWVHIVVHFNRANNKLNYTDVVVNGVTVPVNLSTDPIASGSGDSVQLAVTLGGNANPDAYSIYVDEMELTYY